MRILIVTDAWKPQVNGVVTTMTQVIQELETAGHEVKVLHPGLYPTVPMPRYAEIRLVIYAKNFRKQIEDFAPDAVHIVTEGPLGLRARAFCIKRGWPFTTSFHTKFAEYLNKRIPLIPVSWGYRFLRFFHTPAERTLVSTQSLIDELSEKDFKHLFKWNRGVDIELFHPKRRRDLELPRPINLYVGRVSVEKNLPAFLNLELEGSKVVVGGGPALDAFRQAYPGIHFLGKHTGEDLAELFASADVFVFPSLTDTYGLVMLEALASGTPVAAYPTTGPIDVLAPQCGVMDEDLKRAIEAALKLNRTACRDYAQAFSWTACAQTFLSALAPIQPVTLTRKAPLGNEAIE